MARAVFQLQRQSDAPSNNNQIQVARSPLKSLPVNEPMTSIIRCLPLTNPTIRSDPLVLITRIKSSSVSDYNVCDITWVLLRLLSRDIIDITLRSPALDAQVIPSGFNSTISDFRPRYSFSFEQNLGCTDLCTCQAKEQSFNSHSRRTETVEDDDSWNVCSGMIAVSF